MSPVAQARFVLTGGIGSGKSTVGRILAESGAVVIDADEVGHSVLEPSGEAFAPVAERWPEAVVDGSIDRRALADVVFGDPDQLRELESITHPAIRREIIARLAEHVDSLVVVEVPLLSEFFDDGWQRIVVDAPDEIRQMRMVDRGMTAGDIRQRMAVQPARADWLDAADVVIDNSGTLDDLAAAVDRFLESIGPRGSDVA